jgi:hypothetical protein
MGKALFVAVALVAAGLALYLLVDMIGSGQTEIINYQNKHQSY